MGPIGIPEMIIIAVVALIFFGPAQAAGTRSVARQELGEFKRASNDSEEQPRR